MNNQIQRRDGDLISRVAGSFADSNAANQRMGWAGNNCHLIAPAPQVGAIPEGTAVALSVVNVDVRDMRDGGEIYSVGAGQFALGRSALNKIAQAAGVSWDPQLSRRIDDGSDPYYCHYRAVGTVRHLDGTEIMITGEKEMDLRDGCPQVQALVDRSKSGDITKQLRELRLHILAHAESKAKNRAIRSLGLKPSFKRADLDKPFVVARLMWTGQSSDPVLRARFAEMTAATFLGGRNAMFGAPVAAPAAMPSALPQHAPPPVGSIGGDFDDSFGMPVFEAEPQAAQLPPQDAYAAPVATHQQPAESFQEEAPQAGASGLLVPGGRDKGKPIESTSDDTLKYWVGRIGGALENGETPSQFVDRDENLVAAMKAEVAKRGSQ